MQNDGRHGAGTLWTLGFACLLSLCLAGQGWAASSSFSDAQLIVLGNAIRANGSLAAAVAGNDKDAIVAYYNALNSEAPTSSAFYVWKTALTPDEYTSTSGIVPAEAVSRTAGQTWAWDTKTGQSTRTIDPSRPGYVALITAVWTGTTTETNLLALSQREATRAEMLFTTGTGTQASPATPAWVGIITVKDVTRALHATA